MAVVHLHGRPDQHQAGVAVADFYRIENSKIIEHWDVVQPIPAEKANPRDMF
jgi:predicted SnoaL-like aldol condensation-catalyzing enzyme